MIKVVMLKLMKWEELRIQYIKNMMKIGLYFKNKCLLKVGLFGAING